jgi:uncharacterized membrane protein
LCAVSFMLYAVSSMLYAVSSMLYAVSSIGVGFADGRLIQSVSRDAKRPELRISHGDARVDAGDCDLSHCACIEEGISLMA